MITCKKCGYDGEFTEPKCPHCRNALILNQEEIDSQLSLIKQALSDKDYDTVAETYRFLAEVGIVEGEREYARYLEKGDVIERDLNLAMTYFKRAAEKNDPYSAYRYSRLATRENDATARFWLIFSAIIGCTDAYPDLAEEFSLSGYEDDANYFYSLAAEAGDTGSIVTMAKRYYSGVGAEQSEKYAKWYMDKFTIPPIYAIKLAYKLRHTQGEEPPVLTLKNYDGLLRSLCAEAEKSGFVTAKDKLLSILSERGDTVAMAEMGERLVMRDMLEEGLRWLNKSASMGNALANVTLGELYRDGDRAVEDRKRALGYFIKAGELGVADAFLYAADMLYDTDEDKRDIIGAVILYDKAAELGSSAAGAKSDAIKKERERLFKLAVSTTDAEVAFVSAGKSADMGYAPAMVKLGECFELGIGTKKNRHGAFLWYKKALELKEDSAYFALGRCYVRGIGVSLDFKRGGELLMLAERTGDERARPLILETLNGKLKKTAQSLYSSAMRLMYQRKFSEAVKMLEIAVEVKHPKSMYTLGCLYEFGRGIPCDKDKAFSLYEEAYSRRFRDPRSKYKLIVLKMVK